MPPTDDLGPQDDVDSQTFTMESRALRHQLDRLRTLQQRNDILSGDRQQSARSQEKPTSLRNYYKWLRESSPAPSTPRGPPTPRPRSQSLQLDAADLSSIVTKSESRGCRSSPGSSQKKPIPCLQVGDSSEENDTTSPCQTPKCVSPTPTKQSKQRRERKSPPQSPKKRGCSSKSSCSKVKLERGTVIKPKVGTQSKSVLSPIKRQRSKSLDTEGAKLIVADSNSVSPTPSRDTPVLPDISPIEINSGKSSSSESLSSVETKKPVSILKHRSSPETVSRSSRSSYAVHVTFDETPYRIPSGYQRGRRASIAEESLFLREDDNAASSRLMSPLPQSPPGTSDVGLAWMAPGVLPRRRNSLPPLSVSLSEIQAAASDDDDDEPLYKNIEPREENYSTDSLVTKSVNFHSDDCTKENTSSPQSSISSSTTSSCFSVPMKNLPAQDDTNNDDDDVKCDVVHSFTPRPRLKHNTLSTNTGLYIGF